MKLLTLPSTMMMMIAFISRVSAFAPPSTRNPQSFLTMRQRATTFQRLFMSSSSSSSSSNSQVTSNDPALEEYSNRNNIDDQVFSALSGCGGIKVTCTTIRNMVNDVMIMHEMNAVPADALARATVCGLLMSNGMQDEQTVQITFNGDGPMRGLVSVTNGLGGVRGYVGNPKLNGFSLEDAVGKGTVQIVKNHPDWPNPYNGITAIRNGEIDVDIGKYLAESEQRSCALAAASKITGILCNAAGGYLVEQLPDCPKETIQKVEQNLMKLVQIEKEQTESATDEENNKLPTNLLLNGYTPVDIASIILDGCDMKPLGQLKPGLECPCSKERFFRSLRLLPREEVDQIIQEQETIEARCEFCGTRYEMTAEEVEEKFATATGDPSLDSDNKHL